MLATTFWELPISSMLAGMRALFPQSVILKLQRTKINKKTRLLYMFGPKEQAILEITSEKLLHCFLRVD